MKTILAASAAFLLVLLAAVNSESAEERPQIPKRSVPREFCDFVFVPAGSSGRWTSLE